MAVEVLDTLGQKCPRPVLKIAVKAPDTKHGDILEVLGDCPTFEKDVGRWCERLGKVFLSVKDEGQNKNRIQIRFYKCHEHPWGRTWWEVSGLIMEQTGTVETVYRVSPEHGF